MDRDLGRVTLSATFERRTFEALMKVLTKDSGDGWSGGVWNVWVTTGDGRRFRVKRFWEQAQADAAIETYEAQLASQSPLSWSKSNGFEELAVHLTHLHRA